jgi:hydroxymethylglutaryl-CoA reductase
LHGTQNAYAINTVKELAVEISKDKIQTENSLKSVNQDYSDFFSGFSKLNHTERLKRLVEMGVLSASDVEFLKQGGLKDLNLAEKFIENTVGWMQLPMGVVTNLRIDDRDVVVPMAVEETSIIAAASKTAKWIRESGSIFTEMKGQEIIGQIQIAKVKNFLLFSEKINQHRREWIDLANREVAFGLVNRGGGVRDIILREIPREDINKESGSMAVIHVLMNPVDAMGANIINQVCEYLKLPIEEATGEKVTMCILSNLVDSKLTEATVVINEIDPELSEKIEEASYFAELDPYRAATNNKGVMNGIDPILLATGNDWRAVEAGVHAYAARSGQYRSITKWRRDGNRLVGKFSAPLVVGTVGGVTALHPTARLSLNMMKVTTANELSRICAALGLVQNLGALKALTTVGIIEGHMKLHIKNLTLGAGAVEKEIPFVVKKLEEILSIKKRISLSNAIEVLRDLRNHQGGKNNTH